MRHSINLNAPKEVIQGVEEKAKQIKDELLIAVKDSNFFKLGIIAACYDSRFLNLVTDLCSDAETVSIINGMKEYHQQFIHD